MTAISSTKADRKSSQNAGMIWQKLIGLKKGCENDFWITIECNGNTVLSNAELFKLNCYHCNITFPVKDESTPVCVPAKSESSDADLVFRFNSSKMSLYAKLKCEADNSCYKSYCCPDGVKLEKGKETEILNLDDLYETLKSRNGHIEVDPRDLKLHYVNGRSISVGIELRAADSLFASLAYRPFSRDYPRIC